MKSLLFCMLGLAMTACAPRKAGNVNNGSDELAMLVGTYLFILAPPISLSTPSASTRKRDLPPRSVPSKCSTRLISSLQKMEGLSMPSAK